MDPNTPQSNIEGPALGFPRSDISDTLPAPKKSPSQTSDSPFENTNIRDLFRKIDVGGENFLECAECHKLLSTTTSTTNLRKHFKIYHQDRGIGLSIQTWTMQHQTWTKQIQTWTMQVQTWTPKMKQNVYFCCLLTSSKILLMFCLCSSLCSSSASSSTSLYMRSSGESWIPLKHCVTTFAWCL